MRTAFPSMLLYAVIAVTTFTSVVAVPVEVASGSVRNPNNPVHDSHNYVAKNWIQEGPVITKKGSVQKGVVVYGSVNPAAYDEIVITAYDAHNKETGTLKTTSKPTQVDPDGKIHSACTDVPHNSVEVRLDKSLPTQCMLEAWGPEEAVDTIYGQLNSALIHRFKGLKYIYHLCVTCDGYRYL
ncbi:hypothetical protein BDP27DRAFT_1325654 [Rhodocollybia butyracea]|uniref:Uncharacterized protein n=1 Tax=Rhodocollybia butyracea TaxID=206335 RepID=A0A9P5PU02_9AGAR|nr:hypothetical protein BDP27DRAFT_1325654 [Rhodocollybia butyracea]